MLVSGLLCSLLIAVAQSKSWQTQALAEDRADLLKQTWNGILNGAMPAAAAMAAQVGAPVAAPASAAVAAPAFAPSAPSPAAASTTPVTRVVNLLKVMTKTLQADIEEDKTLFEELVEWCQTNSDEKKTAIEENTDKVADLETSIAAKTSDSSSLKETIKELEAAVADNKAALAKATTLRQKELAAFNTDQNDGTASVANLKAAITVLSKHNGVALPQLSAISFLQEDDQDDDWLEKVQRLRSSSESKFLQQVQQARPMPDQMPLGEWTVHEVAAVKKALRSAHSFVQRRGEDTYVPAYSSNSGEIFGILQTMKEEMEADLEDSKKTEAARAADYAELRTAKTAEVQTGEIAAETKEDQLAENDSELAEAKEDLGQTEKTLAKDTKFAANLQATCEEATVNFDKRKAARTKEMKAVEEAIEILTTDEAAAAMASTFGIAQDSSASAASSAFIQISSKRHSMRRHKAAQLLRRQALRSGNSELNALASNAELDEFTKVKKMADKMIKALTIQQADEVKKNDYCKEELHSNEMATLKANDRKDDIEATITDLEQTMSRFESEVNNTKAKIAQEEASTEKATEMRETENKEFIKTVSDQEVAVEILTAAMEKLANYYDLLQTGVVAEKYAQTPPVMQVKYEKSKGAEGVLSIIEKLIYDAKEIMSVSKSNEAKSLADYNELVEDSEDTIKALSKQVLAKTDSKVETKKTITLENIDLNQTKADLVSLSSTDADLHTECDFLLLNFDVRQQARNDEVESLKQAKMLLNGAASAE
jgi:hypothetical protein